MTVYQSLSEFPPLSPVFPLLIIMALPFLISPASNLKQENSYFSSDAEGDGILPEAGNTIARVALLVQQEYMWRKRKKEVRDKAQMWKEARPPLEPIPTKDE